MGRKYFVAVGGISHSMPQDMLGIYAGEIPLKIRQFGINSYNATSSVSIDVEFVRYSGTITPGSGGSSRTPSPLKSTDSSPSFTVRSDDTTQMTGTTSENLIAYGINVEIGWIYTPPKDCCIVLQPGEALSIGGGIGGGSVDISFFAIIEELS